MYTLSRYKLAAPYYGAYVVYGASAPPIRPRLMALYKICFDSSAVFIKHIAHAPTMIGVHVLGRYVQTVSLLH